MHQEFVDLVVVTAHREDFPVCWTTDQELMLKKCQITEKAYEQKQKHVLPITRPFNLVCSMCGHNLCKDNIYRVNFPFCRSSFLQPHDE